MWIQKYGSQRAQRNTNVDLNSWIFVPHRYEQAEEVMEDNDNLPDQARTNQQYKLRSRP